MKGILTRALAAAAITAMCGSASASSSYEFFAGDGVRYAASFNRHGATLRSRGVVLYLGRSCDAYSPQLGNGRWGQANGGFFVDIRGATIGFPRQELFDVNEGVACDAP